MTCIARTWSTGVAPAGAEVAYWERALSEAVCELDVGISNPHEFVARIDRHALGELAVSAIALNSEQTIQRAPPDIARARPAQFHLLVVEHGTAELEHCDAIVALRPGDSVLIDDRRACRLSTSREFRGTCVHIPADWLACRVQKTCAMVARPIRSESPWGMALSSMVGEISPANGPIEPVCAQACAERIVGVLQAEFSDDTTSDDAISPFERVRQALRAHAYDSTLDEKKLARLIGISPACLRDVFASRGTMYRSELLSARLALAARLLSDLQFAEISIAAISARCGFTDPCHFSRRFRGRYGQPPGAFRNPTTLCTERMGANQNVAMHENAAI